MKIIILGYGQMGKALESLSMAQGHEIIARFSSTNKPTRQNIPREADVAIEFSNPESAFDNIRLCLETGIPVVSGTTGWLEKKPEIERYCREMHGAFLYASNFSIGMNILFRLNKQLASMMEAFPQYTLRLLEIHHIRKLDAPSGTAITLAEQVLGSNSRYKGWTQDLSDTPDDLLPVESIREGDVKGVHELTWESADDRISIRHEAFSRDAFARGALFAAHWLAGKEGVYSFEDIFSQLTG